MCLTVTTGTTISCEHRPAVDEASPADEVEAVGPLGNPELHVALGPRRHARLAVPGRLVVGELVADQVALLRQDRAVRLVVRACSCPSRRGPSR